MIQKRNFLLFFFLLVSILCFSQGATNRAYWSYIDKYKDIAIEQMHKYRIPASVTMAQGLLESAAGRSTLATEAHNHFGIKTPGGWTGPYVVRDDDRKGEHFRKYRTDRESYEDHSLFLKKKRYERLFTLRITDYKGWCHGLKACGYATSPTYAQTLIRIIEMYSLYQLDTMKPGRKSAATLIEENKADQKVIRKNKRARSKSRREKQEEQISQFFNTHMVYMNNKSYFIVVQSGDDLATIARETGNSIRKLRKYNDLSREFTLTVGDIIYLEQKQKKGAKEFAGIPHVVEEGQSLYDISQLYGIRMKYLYRLNGLPNDYVAKVGDKIWVR